MADNLLNYFRWVESKNNDLVKQLMAHQVGGRSAAKLRKEQALTLLEGTHLLDSWYRAGHSASLKTIITNPASVDIPEVKELITYSYSITLMVYKIKISQFILLVMFINTPPTDIVSKVPF